MNTDTTRRTLYPEILKPNDCGMLKVSPLHTIYWEECGNPKGKPVLFLHGGPGGGLKPIYRRYFDPEHYRIILFDQRGCGKSTPHASIKRNTTWDLVGDIEDLRDKLGIEVWMVFGGSWGSTLALAYAENFPTRVTALVLRGIFLCRPSEIAWFYQDGASHIWPDAWEDFLKPIPEEERHNMVLAYHRRLMNDDEKIQLEAARHWSIWEGATSKIIPSVEIEKFGEDIFALAFARIENHYFINNMFFNENQLLRNVSLIRHIPAVIVQGRHDSVCPMRSAWDLHRAWPEADFRIVRDAGHSCKEPGIIHELVSATDRFRTL